jgi:hypothetical protein
MVKPAAGSTPLAYSSPEAVQTTGTVALSYVNLLPSGAALAQSQEFESLSPTLPTMYWWDSGGVGVFYTQDETNTIVILVGVSHSSHEFARLLNAARERIRNA